MISPKITQLSFKWQEEKQVKNVMKRLIIFGICASMLVGCTKNDGTGDKTNSQSSAAAASGQNTAVDVKLKYADQEKFEYTDPLYNLGNDHRFTYAIGENFYDAEEYEAFQVYSDSDFEHPVDIKIEEDIDTDTLTISPGLVFSYEKEEDSGSDGTWGSRSRFWLVQYLDTDTGKELDKPLVTVFSIAQDMNTPTMKQSVGGDGYYKLTWSPVDGAEYYEVYEYDPGMEYAELIVTTEGTECSNDDFSDVQDYEERFKEKYGDTEIDVNTQYTMNHFMDMGYTFFVVAKTSDGKHSGMSNECDPAEMLNQIPVSQSWDFQTEYEGTDALALPAYVDIEMMDGSVGKYLIEYHGATVTLLEDGTIMVQPTIKNLPIAMWPVSLTGVDYDTFMEQADKLAQRGDELEAKTGTAAQDIDIPFVPDSSEPSEDGNTAPEEEESGIELPENVAQTVYANSALSEWIALNLLAHNEVFSLDGFPEASDADRLEDALLEAYKQNPLCGTLNTFLYDYESNSLEVTYVQSEQEQQEMQQECLKKAAEIADEIITDGMSDYEKEVAINQYLCDNAEYNDQIMDYINEDGTISEEAVEQFADSFTPYGVLVENFGVCESYAEAFQLVAREAGLEAVIVTGVMDGVGHEWNRVLLDGQWYTLDVTNNDSEYVNNALCNLSDDVAAEVLKQDEDALLDDCVGNYTADDMKNEYYTVNGLYTEDAGEAAEILARGLQENGRAVVRMDSSFGSTSLDEIVQTAVNEAQSDSVMYYAFANVIAVIEQ